MGGGHDSDEAKTRSERTKEQVHAKNRNRKNTFQSNTPAGRRIFHSCGCLYIQFFDGQIPFWMLQASPSHRACQATLAYSLRQVALLAALLVLANGSAVPSSNGHGGTPIAGWFMMENPWQFHVYMDDCTGI